MTNTYGTRKRRFTRKQVIIASVAGAVLLAPGAAYAAVKIFGLGEGAVDGTAVQNLTIDNIGLESPLVPGATVDGKAIVHNPNNFPVKISTAYIRAEGTTGTGPAGSNCATAGIVKPGGVAGNYGPPIGQGWKIDLPGSGVAIPKNGAVWITVPNAVTLSSDADALCGFSGKFAVEGTVG